MGDVLRQTIDAARTDNSFRRQLGDSFGISSAISIFDASYNPSDLIKKAQKYEGEISSLLHDTTRLISQLDWLSFCVNRGLLIPDDWTERIIDAHFKKTLQLQDGIFVLDGCPRTTIAAERLLQTFDQLGIGIIKVIHRSITKEQMKVRAENRKRDDDKDRALDSRYQFYIEKVQPCIDFLKMELGPGKVALVDAHQPVFHQDDSLDLEKSIRAVTISVIEALGLPHYLLDLTTP
jgi:adenylate kinase family enzyme